MCMFLLCIYLSPKNFIILSNSGHEVRDPLDLGKTTITRSRGRDVYVLDFRANVNATAAK